MANEGKGPGCMGLIGLALVFGFFGSMCDDGSGDVSGDGYGAAEACKDWVEEQLKAPSSADFSNVDVSGSGPWTVTGDVDSENSFGAKLRAPWTCDVRLEGDYYRGSATVLE